MEIIALFCEIDDFFLAYEKWQTRHRLPEVPPETRGRPRRLHASDMDDGEYGKWYGSIRIPFSTSKTMREVAESDPKFANGALQELEEECLTKLKLFDDQKMSEQEVLKSVNEYSALLQRKKTYNRFSERHQELLNERPWEKSPCKVCKDAGINIVVFRSANRNRRRGFHNTWVFYHKVLHRKHNKSSKKIAYNSHM